MTTGRDGFAEVLAKAGCQVEVRGPLVLVLVYVPLGPHRDTEVWVGADPPNDFPTVPPHWVHLPESINLADGGKRASELGQGWAKWSRPHKGWADSASPASQWLAHARSLLNSALS